MKCLLLFYYIELDNQSRGNNLPIGEIFELPNKTWEKWALKVQELLKMKLEIPENIEHNPSHHVASKTKIKLIHQLLFAEYQHLKLSKEFQ